MSRSFTIAAALFFAAATAWAADPKTSQTKVSGNGNFSIRMTAEDGACHIQAFKGENEPLWQVDQCVGSPDDAYFISNDGRRFWVLRTTPEKPGAPHGKAKGLPWYKVEVATLYDSQGQALQSRRLSELVPPKDREKVRQLGKHFTWLQGEAGMSGKPPRINDAGQVELEVAGATTVQLNF